MTNLLNGFLERITSRRLNVLSVRVLQRGRLLDACDLGGDVRRQQHSVSKSFTCMAVGLAIREGKLSLDTRIRDLFPEHAKEVHGSAYPPGELALPLDRPPGEKFTYSSGDTFIISAMVQAAVGQTVLEYLTPRLFEPLGIDRAEWDTSPLGVTLGCAGLRISNAELARFGQLLLQKGKWQEQQLVPAEWIEFATRKHIETDGSSEDWGKGYGFQFWMCSHGAYRADGMKGQFCVIVPEKAAVIAINSDEDDMQGILDAVWSDLLPQLFR